MKENLNLDYNRKKLVSVALRRFKLKKDAAAALGITTKCLENYRKQWGWP